MHARELGEVVVSDCVVENWSDVGREQSPVADGVPVSCGLRFSVPERCEQRDERHRWRWCRHVEGLRRVTCNTASWPCGVSDGLQCHHRQNAVDDDTDQPDESLPGPGHPKQNECVMNINEMLSDGSLVLYM